MRLGNYGRLKINGDCTVKDLTSSGFGGVIIGGKGQMSRMTFTGGGYVELGDTLFVDTCLLDTNTNLTHKTITRDSIYTVTIYAGLLSLNKGSKIDVTGKGYPKGTSVTGVNTSTFYIGGSYGGAGKSAFFPIYGSFYAPVNAGSGGGSLSIGASGGGIVRVITKKLICDGDILANGATDYYGDGAGGSIWINAEDVEGNGSIQANGGKYNYPGGGGRIAIHSCNIAEEILNHTVADGYAKGTFA